MEDEKIIDLYWERKDEAIMETQAAYGRQLQTIAQRRATRTRRKA